MKKYVSLWQLDLMSLNFGLNPHWEVAFLSF